MPRKPIDAEDDELSEGDAEAQEPELRPGQVVDFVSGRTVPATSEEVEAVQVFARRLVEDYDYPKSNLQTRPQWRVRRSPSDEARSVPVDIAVFRSSQHVEDDLHIVVECKKPTRKDGIHQLKLYLDMSAAEIGVWFNGKEHAYLRKVHQRGGTRTYEEIPNIPRYQERVEDIGLYKRRQLKKPSNLKAVFRDIRHHLAGMAKGMTRDEALAQEIINILFCKIHDELSRAPDETVLFHVGISESCQTVKKRISSLFEEVKGDIADVFDVTDEIKLDERSLYYVVGELQNYCLMDADRDAIGDAFEVFIGPALRGQEGQFFTPRNVVEMMVSILDPKPGEKIIDPACGSGGFLIAAFEHIRDYLTREAEQKKWKPRQLAARETQIATNCFRGVDKDSFLTKVSKAYMKLIGDGRGGIYCENALTHPDSWTSGMKAAMPLGSFDVLLTNPPFGKKIVVEEPGTLRQYELGFEWAKDSATGDWTKTDKLRERQPPQILFIERCLAFLKPGGRMGIVLPESLFGMPTHEYVVAFLQERTKIRAIVSMPEALFKTSGKGGTHTKVCVVFIENTEPKAKDDYPIFMADVRWCGHDSRGNPTIRDGKLLDEVPLVAERFRETFSAW